MSSGYLEDDFKMTSHKFLISCLVGLRLSHVLSSLSLSFVLKSEPKILRLVGVTLIVGFGFNITLVSEFCKTGVERYTTDLTEFLNMYCIVLSTKSKMLFIT